MNTLFILCAILGLLSVPTHALSWQPTPGDLFHVTGCENGKLMTPTVNLWSKPGGIAEGAKVVGRLSGDGRADKGLKCQGAVVKVMEIKDVKGGTFLKVQSVVNANTGWITDSFVGRKFDKAKCKSFFKDPQHIKNCLE